MCYVSVLSVTNGKYISSKMSNSKRKLSYYFEALKTEDDPAELDIADSPTKLPESKRQRSWQRSRVSFGCPRDSDWQRRMDGFSGLNLANDKFSSGQRFSKKKKNEPELCREPTPPPTQQEIEDWESSDEELAEPTTSVTHSESRLSRLSRPKPRPRSTRKLKDVAAVSDNYDYCADEVHRVEDDYCVSDESLSPVISDVRSQSPEQTPHTGRKSTASDWVKDICWNNTTPQKSSTAEHTLEDSSKKKRPKYLTDGLADSLQRIIQQQKSSQTFRSHKYKSGTVEKCEENTKSLTVEIQCVCNGPSLVSAVAAVIVTPKDSFLPAPGQCLTVLFSAAICTQLKLAPHTRIMVHPPWQILKPSGLRKVLLCTGHVEVAQTGQQEVTKTGQGKVTQKGSTATDGESQIIARWKCPCSQDAYIRPIDCAAHKNPVDVSQKPSCTPEHTSGQLTTEQACMEGTLLEQNLLQESSPATQTISHSMLTAIENSGTVRGVSFTATVQRIFYKETKFVSMEGDNCGESASDITKHSAVHSQMHSQLQSEVHSLLLQDFCGFLCELVLPSGGHNKELWCSVVAGGEGRVYEFTKLRVSQRLNRNKSSGLFSVIDRVWKASSVLEKPGTSQDSQEPELSVIHPPSFCYILHATLGESSCRPASISCSTSNCLPSNLPSVYSPAVYSPAVYTSFTQLPPHSTDTCRITIEARIVYREVDGPDSSPQDMIHVVPTTRERGSIAISLSNITYSRITASTYKSFLFKDVLVNNGRCALDEYSCVCYVHTANPLDTDIISRLCPIDGAPQAHVLYAVQGIIAAVDEDSAFSWSVCDRCDNDKLHAGSASQPFLYCPKCKRGVPQPKNRMNLEIFIRVSDNNSSVVKIKLLQETIEAILPHTTEDDEGYDMQSVLDKPIGPIAVMLISSSKKLVFLQEIQLDL